MKQDYQYGYARYEIQLLIYNSQRFSDNCELVYECAYMPLFGVESEQKAREHRNILQEEHDEELYSRFGEENGPRYELYEYIDGEFSLLA